FFPALLRVLARLRQQVERALDVGDHPGSDACVASRRLQFVVSQQRLNESDIGAALEQMGCEAVAERMQRHALPDPGGFCRLVEYAVEVPRGHRPAASLSARK